MRIFKIAMASILLLSAQSALTTPLYDGTYDIANAGSGHNRGIWTNVGSLSTVSGTFSVTGSSAVFAGDVFSSALNGGLTWSINMTHKCSSRVSNAGGNYVSIDNNGSGPGGCDGMINQKTVRFVPPIYVANVGEAIFLSSSE